MSTTRPAGAPEDQPRDLFRSCATTELRAADVDGDDGPELVGHFLVFNQWTEINSMWEGNFLERIAPGAAKKTLRENSTGIRVLLNHGMDPELGDKPLGVPRSLEEDEYGVAYAVPLFRGIPELVMEGLRHGQYGASFRFQVMREDIDNSPDESEHNPRGLPERTIRELRLMEFGPVTFPAYAGATSGVRSLTDHFIVPRLGRHPHGMRADEPAREPVATAAETASTPDPVRGSTSPADRYLTQKGTSPSWLI